MDIMKQQLSQMQQDHRMSEQPILDFESPKFEIERPRFYYSPPEDRYSYLARYLFSLKIRNVSNYPALFVDVNAELLVEENGVQLCLGAVSQRLNIIAANCISNPTSTMFAGDRENRILSALRSYSTLGLPKIHVTICYKSLSGAAYLLEHTYWLDISDKNEQDIEILKNWHSNLTAAPVSEKELLDRLKKTSDEKEQKITFDIVKDSFDKKLIGEKSLPLCMIEIPEDFSLKAISDEEFRQEMKNHHYGHYVGHHVGIGLCKSNPVIQENSNIC